MYPHSAGNAAALSAATIALLGVLVSRSDAQIPSLERTMIDYFIGNCVLNLPNTEKIRAASRVLGWKSMPADVATMLGPLDPQAKYEGWLAQEATFQFLIGISAGNLGSQPVVSCTVAHPEIQQAAVIGQLPKSLDLKFLNDEREAGQRYRSWTTQANGYSVLVTFTSMQDANSPGGSIAAAVKVR